MRVLNILVAALVLVGAVIVSYSHTAQLFAQNGYSGWLVHVGVGVVELTFLMGALNIVTARVKGVRVGVPPMLGGLLGVLVVGYSNVRAGLPYGFEGVALGAVIPLSLIVTEGILAWAILTGRKAGEPPTQQAEPEDVGETAHPAQRITQQVDPSPAQVDEVGEPEQEPPTDPGEPAQQIAQVGEEPPSPAQVATNEKQEQAKTPIPAVRKVDREFAPPATIITEDPVKVAARIMEEEGKLPSRRKLSQLAGCSEYRARKVLDELKQAI